MSVNVLPSTIVHYPDPRLRRKCRPIGVFDGSLAELAQRMLQLMKANRGVGLAGPQVGVSKRIFVCNPTGEPGDDHVYVNPELVELTGTFEATEGCLSLPEITVTMRRAKRCRMRAFDVTGRPFVAEAEDLLARIWQHETDHLDGKLIIDRMNGTDKIANKKAIAQLETDFRKAVTKEANLGRAGRMPATRARSGR